MPIKTIEQEDLKLLGSLSIGSRVCYLRKLLNDLYREGFSVTEVAKKIEVTHQSLSALERNTIANPSFKVIHNLSKVFNISIDVLTDDYYLKKPRPFTIGFEDGIITEEEEVEEKSTKISTKVKFGALHYQLLEDGQLIFTHDIQTSKPVEVASQIQIIARYDFEHKLLNTVSELGNPQLMVERGRSYNDILQQYFRTLDDPTHPRVISDRKERLIKAYFERNPLK